MCPSPRPPRPPSCCLCPKRIRPELGRNAAPVAFATVLKPANLSTLLFARSVPSATSCARYAP
eukprot:571367-Lingulodinium_polyedra.AAC.1